MIRINTLIFRYNDNLKNYFSESMNYYGDDKEVKSFLNKIWKDYCKDREKKNYVKLEIVINELT